MAKWTDLAQWVGPTQNENPGGMAAIMGVVLHIQQGNQDGSISWCKNPASQVSAHFFASKSGQLVQLVDTADRAWAEAAGNPYWLSIECEGYSGQPLTLEQVSVCAAVLARAHALYGVPLESTDDPRHGGLGWHGMGGDAWGGHPDCPGEPVKAQRPSIISTANLLVLGNPFPRFPGRTLIYSAGLMQMHGSDVHAWQARMAERGWSISVDGWYGPQSAGVCRAFQADSTAHGWPLAEDGKVGPLTWDASWQRPVTR